MNTIKYYFSIYKEFISTSINESMSFRLHFVLLILMDLTFYAVSLASVYFIFDHVDTIGPWNRSEFLFFIGFMLAIDHLHMTFISENFWEFSDDLRLGNLDFILIKPAAAIFTIFFRRVRAASFLNIFTTSYILYYFGTRANLSLSSWFLLPFFLVLGLTLIVSIEILLSMATFWVIEGFGLNFLRMQFQSVSRWPDFIYKNVARKVFTFFIPVLLVGSAPVRFLINNKDWHLLVLFVLMILIVWVFIRIFWRLGLKHYESASS